MNPTKLIAVLVSMCCVALAQGEMTAEQMQKLMGYHTECQTETNIDDNLATGALAGNFVDDPVLKQHILCISKKMGVMNDAGELQMDTIQAKIASLVSDDGKVTELMESCAVEKGSPEETAFEMTKCIYDGTH